MEGRSAGAMEWDKFFAYPYSMATAINEPLVTAYGHANVIMAAIKDMGMMMLTGPNDKGL
jgi:hypothetical protein